MAARALALVLSMILLSVVATIAVAMGLAGLFFLIENLPYFLVLAVIVIVLLGITALATILVSAVRDITVPWITTGPGVRVSLWTVGAIWFLVGFHRAITEQPASAEFALALVVSAMLLWSIALAKMFTAKGRFQIAAASCGYVCIVMLYAGVYNILFLVNPLSFVFSPAIVEGEVLEASFANDLLELRDLQTRIYLATLLVGNPTAGLAAANSHRGGDTAPQAIGPESGLRFIWVPDPPGGNEMHLILIGTGEEHDMSIRGRSIRHPEHEQVASIYFASSEEEFRLRTTALLGTYREKRDRLQGRIEATLAGRPEWGLLEFCYFSSMTQTSAGFGDIMPNNGTVRLVVVSQALVGLVYISFVIAFIRGGGGSTHMPADESV